MKYKYEKPSVKISNWLVTKEDLEKIYNYFLYRFKKEVYFEVKTTDGESHSYDFFKEFEDDLDKIITNKEKIGKISIGASSHVGKVRKHAWITIEFEDWVSARFNLLAEDEDGSSKDWVEGTYSDLSKLQQSLEIEDNKFIKRLRNKFPSRWGSDTVVIFDPFSKIKSEIKNDNPETINQITNNIKIQKEWYEKPAGLLILSVIAGIIIAYFNNWFGLIG